MAQMDGVHKESVAPEDRELVERLAKLQDMSTQIVELRSLLPERLINPTRIALERPGNFAPEKLAAQLQTAARSGFRDVQKFKKDWHSEDVREIWQRTSTSETPQGQDGWTTDYVNLVKILQDQNNDVSATTQQQESISSEEIATEAVKKFRERNPSFKLTVLDESQGHPVDLEVSKMIFRIDTNDRANGSKYTISATPDSKVSDFQAQVIKQGNVQSKNLGLLDLLEMLAAYNDIRTQPCENCHTIVDANLKYPTLRKLKVSQDAERKKTWMPYHPACL